MESIKVIGKCEKEVRNVQLGDQIIVPLAGMGEFTATAHKITNDGVLFIFDEYIARRRMNKKHTNKGGFEKSDLKEWLDTDLYMAFPESMRKHIEDISLPTVGQLFGHEDEWDAEYFEPDADEQLPLMKKRSNRTACFKNCFDWGWLRNVTTKDKASFAISDGYGNVNYHAASNFIGIRPEFWLDVKGEC